MTIIELAADLRSKLKEAEKIASTIVQNGYDVEIYSSTHSINTMKAQRPAPTAVVIEASVSRTETI